MSNKIAYFVHLPRLVKQNPCLYDHENERFSDREWKDQLWSRLAEAIKHEGDGASLEMRWKNLRDRYQRRKRAVQQGREKHLFASLAEFAFLDPYIFAREVHTQVCKKAELDGFKWELIAEVRANPCLYKQSNRKEDIINRQNAWENIKERMKFNGSVKQLTAHWKNLRDRFFREKRAFESTVQRDGRQIQTSELYKRMVWLDEFLALSRQNRMEPYAIPNRQNRKRTNEKRKEKAVENENTENARTNRIGRKNISNEMINLNNARMLLSYQYPHLDNRQEYAPQAEQFYEHNELGRHYEELETVRYETIEKVEDRVADDHVGYFADDTDDTKECGDKKIPYISDFDEHDGSGMHINNKIAFNPLQMLPCKPALSLNTHDIFILAVDFIVPFSCVAFLVVVLTVETFTFLILLYSNILLLDQKISGISSRTIDLQKKFAIALTVQILLPFVLVLTPASYVLLSIFLEYYNQSLNNLVFVLTALHGFSSTIVMIFIHRPYREVSLYPIHWLFAKTDPNFTCPSTEITENGQLPTGRSTPAIFPANYFCELSFVVPAGSFVTFEASAFNVNDEDFLAITDTLNGTYRINGTHTVNSLAIDGNYARLVLSTAPGFASFFVKWTYRSAASLPSNQQKTGTILELRDLPVLTPTLFTSSDGGPIVLSIDAAACTFFYTSILVFDGTFVNSTFIGALTERTLKSTGSSLTLVKQNQIACDSGGRTTFLLANDYSAISNFTSYTFGNFAWEFPLAANSSVTVFNANTESFLLTNLTTQSSSTSVQIQSGSPTNHFHPVISYRGNCFANLMPQQIATNFFTITVTHGSAAVSLGYPANAGSITVWPGLAGHLTSRSTWQPSTEWSYDRTLRTMNSGFEYIFKTFRFSVGSLVLGPDEDSLNIEVGDEFAPVDPVTVTFKSNVSNSEVHTLQGSYMRVYTLGTNPRNVSKFTVSYSVEQNGETTTVTVPTTTRLCPSVFTVTSVLMILLTSLWA
ncbi:unnamed protein product [Caenorhabditis sp. 36 PRJEB53466]|nr:unnamed protein product [Caenorhabditis sp. 36 PRJEB53466]